MAKKRERHQNPQPFLANDNASVSSKKCSKSREGRKQLQEENLLSSGISSKILKEALIQQREIEDEQNPNGTLKTVAEEPVHEDAGEEDDIDNFNGFDDTQSRYGDYEEIDEEDEKLLEAFLSKESAVPQRTLDDIIVAKIKEKDAIVSSEVRPLPKMDTSIIDLY